MMQNAPNNNCIEYPITKNNFDAYNGLSNKLLHLEEKWQFQLTHSLNKKNTMLFYII